MRLQFFKGDELNRGRVSGFEIDWRGATMVEGGVPTRHANTRLGARFQSGESPFRHRRHEIVAIQHREIEKLLCHFHATGVKPDVFRPGPAITVTIKPRHRIAATTAELSPKNVCRHART